jgi:hypothetical protein
MVRRRIVFALGIGHLGVIYAIVTFRGDTAKAMFKKEKAYF